MHRLTFEREQLNLGLELERERLQHQKEKEERGQGKKLRLRKSAELQLLTMKFDLGNHPRSSESNGSDDPENRNRMNEGPV